MKKNLCMLLCMLTALSGHIPEQHASQQSNQSTSWLGPAFAGLGCGFFLGSWFMHRHFQREINRVRSENKQSTKKLNARVKRVNDNGQNTRRALIQLNERVNTNNLNTYSKFEAHTTCLLNIATHLDQQLNKISAEFETVIGYPPSQEKNHDTDIIWMQQKINAEKKRLHEQSVATLTNIVRKNAQLMNSNNNAVLRTITSNNETNTTLRQNTMLAMVLSLCPRTAINIFINRNDNPVNQN